MDGPLYPVKFMKVQLSGLTLNGTFIPLCVKAAKPVTTVQACVSMVESVKILDIFQDILGQFTGAFVATKLDIIRQENDLLNPNQNISTFQHTFFICSGVL